METKHKVYNNSDFIKIMKKESKKDNYVYIGSVIFGSLFISKYKYPSKISINAISDTPYNFKGYWKNGKFYKFPENMIIKYNNSCMGTDK